MRPRKPLARFIRIRPLVPSSPSALTSHVSPRGRIRPKPPQSLSGPSGPSSPFRFLRAIKSVGSSSLGSIRPFGHPALRVIWPSRAPSPFGSIRPLRSSGPSVHPARRVHPALGAIRFQLQFQKPSNDWLNTIHDPGRELAMSWNDGLMQNGTLGQDYDLDTVTFVLCCNVQHETLTPGLCDRRLHLRPSYRLCGGDSFTYHFQMVREQQYVTATVEIDVSTPIQSRTTTGLTLHDQDATGVVAGTMVDAGRLKLARLRRRHGDVASLLTIVGNGL